MPTQNRQPCLRLPLALVAGRTEPWPRRGVGRVLRKEQHLPLRLAVLTSAGRSLPLRPDGPQSQRQHFPSGMHKKSMVGFVFKTLLTPVVGPPGLDGLFAAETKTLLDASLGKVIFDFFGHASTLFFLYFLNQ